MNERDVEARLHAALGAGLDGHVDVVTLVAGARAGARRVRRRRRVAAGAVLVTALAVPAGTALFAWQHRPDDEGLRVAASLRDTPSLSLVPDPTDAATPVVSARPAPEVDPATLAPDENAVDIPLDVLTTAADLPVPMVRLDAMQYRLTPVVMGQACNEDRGGTEPIAGVSDMWAEEKSNRLDQLSISTNVSGYSLGQGAKAFTEARRDTGSCRWLDPASVTDFTAPTGGPAFTRVSADGATQTASQTVVQVGDLLVGVQVSGVGTVAFDDTSRMLAEIVAKRLLQAQVPGSAG